MRVSISGVVPSALASTGAIPQGLMFPVSAAMLKNPALYDQPLEALFDFVELTIKHELVEELDFLVSYDKTQPAIQEIVDMPDRLIDLFIQLCLQGGGHLSSRKRGSHFGFLTDDELAGVEDAVRQGRATE